MDAVKGILIRSSAVYRSKRLLIVGCIVGSVLLAACGGGSDSTGGGVTSGQSQGQDPGGGSSALSEAEESVARQIAGIGMEIPSTSPPAQKGNNVWYISRG